MFRRISAAVCLALATAGCAAGRPAAAPTATLAFAVRTIDLPGSVSGTVSMDGLAWDRSRHRVWAPAGNTASVDVVDTSSDRVTRIEGFATAEVERAGTKRTVGPSSAAVGDGVVYVGNRADSSVCAIDAESLGVGSCVRLDSPPDAIAYVASTKEVWATAPHTNAIVILDAAAGHPLRRKAGITLEGKPEGLAVDDSRGFVYTNLEDADRTLVIDLQSRQVTRTWQPACGGDGPKGLVVDPLLNFLMVACPDHVLVLDAAHNGKRLSTIAMGDGIDDIDYDQTGRKLYAAAARTATLTIAQLDDHGTLTPSATVATTGGARNAVVTDDGTAFLTDSREGKLLVVAPVAVARTAGAEAPVAAGSRAAP